MKNIFYILLLINIIDDYKTILIFIYIKTLYNDIFF